jgi:hypothetical protein
MTPEEFEQLIWYSMHGVTPLLWSAPILPT